MKIIEIVYATKTGTSRDVAERIAGNLNTALKSDEIQAEAVELGNTNGGASPWVTIAGGPINGMRMRPDIAEFIDGESLFAVFSVSYLVKHAGNMWKKSITNNVARHAANASAESYRVFGGRGETAMPGFARFLFGLPKDMPMETLDMSEVDEWSGEMVELLKAKI